MSMQTKSKRVVRHLPSTWEKLTGVKVYDPDGWLVDGKSWMAPLTEKEWNIRKAASTCCHRNGVVHGRGAIAKSPRLTFNTPTHRCDRCRCKFSCHIDGCPECGAPPNRVRQLPQ